jgi:hypothetical protein
MAETIHRVRFEDEHIKIFETERESKKPQIKRIQSELETIRKFNLPAKDKELLDRFLSGVVLVHRHPDYTILDFKDDLNTTSHLALNGTGAIIEGVKPAVEAMFTPGKNIINPSQSRFRDGLANVIFQGFHTISANDNGHNSYLNLTSQGKIPVEVKARFYRGFISQYEDLVKGMGYEGKFIHDAISFDQFSKTLFGPLLDKKLDEIIHKDITLDDIYQKTWFLIGDILQQVSVQDLDRYPRMTGEQYKKIARFYTTQEARKASMPVMLKYTDQRIPENQRFF